MPDYEKNEQAAAAKADKPKKDAKKSKPGFFARIGKWFREMKVRLQEGPVAHEKADDQQHRRRHRALYRRWHLHWDN